MKRRAFLAAALAAPFASALPKRPKLERFAEAFFGVDRTVDVTLLSGLRVIPDRFVPRGVFYVFDSTKFVNPADATPE